jgi:hypothetical protein
MTRPTQRQIAQVVCKNEFAGVGSVVQLAGVAALAGAIYAGYEMSKDAAQQRQL